MALAACGLRSLLGGHSRILAGLSTKHYATQIQHNDFQLEYLDGDRKGESDNWYLERSLSDNTWVCISGNAFQGGHSAAQK